MIEYIQAFVRSTKKWRSIFYVKITYRIYFLSEYRDYRCYIKAKLIWLRKKKFTFIFCLFSFVFFFFFLWWHLQHMRVFRLGVELEVQLQAYDTATSDHSRVYDLCCSLTQCQILNLLSKPRDQTGILTRTMSGS